MQKQSDANGELLGSPLRFTRARRINAVNRAALKLRILIPAVSEIHPPLSKKVLPMKEKAVKSAALTRMCQGVSPDDEPCGQPATMHCPTCGRWFCGAHAEDDEWHQCVLPSGEEGGEA